MHRRPLPLCERLRGARVRGFALPQRMLSQGPLRGLRVPVRGWVGRGRLLATRLHRRLRPSSFLLRRDVRMCAAASGA